jgi:hypothetical protein
MTRAWLHLTIATVAVTAAAAPAHATQYMVSPNDDWKNFVPRLKPGDEVLLMPGRHVPFSIEGLEGTEQQPIIIRGWKNDFSSYIDAREYGIHLSRPKFVVIQDIRVIGATGNGINIDDGGTNRDDNPNAEPWPSGVRIRRVEVLRTGPSGNTDGIKLSGLRGARIEDSLIEGWGGSAIDMVGCHDVNIDRCTFRGMVDYAQASGVQAKGGSQNIHIAECEFIDAGSRAVNAGGSTGLEYFRPALKVDDLPASRFEALGIQIERCLFIGGECAVAFVGSSRVSVQQCTIIRPRMWAFRILQETTDARFAPSQRGLFSRNIIIWDAASLKELFNIGPGTEPSSFMFEDNLWWADGVEAQPELTLPGQQAFPQVVGVDPRLNEKHQPQNPEARNYGRPMALPGD